MDFLVQRFVFCFYVYDMTNMFLGRDDSVFKHPLSLNDPLICRLQGERGEPGPTGPAGLKGDGFLGPTVRK